ncbi:DUF3016 domain-containing protein [Aliikangiella sp. IMCC44653]
MKNTSSKLIAVMTGSLILFFASASLSAAVEIKLIEPSKFRDAEVAGESKKQSYQSLEKELVKVFKRAISRSPEQKLDLNVEVTNVDLAGDIEYFWNQTGREMRVVKNNDLYKLQFNFTIKDTQGNVIKQGNEEIKNFLRNTNYRHAANSSALIGYMQKDINDWLKRSLAN